jgi:hypothetical protein
MYWWYFSYTIKFFSSIRKSDIDLSTLNIFKEKVFQDTSYSICSFQFTLKHNIINIYPSKNI